MSDAKQFPQRGRDSDVSRSGTSSADAAAMLQVGLLALKQKDYGQAIAQLEAVCQTAANRSDRTKAEMGLVKAYARTQQPQRSIALCKTLCRSPNPQVQHWANQTLSDLEHRYSITPPIQATAEIDETGFVPIDADDSFIASAIGAGPTVESQPALPNLPPLQDSRSVRPLPSAQPAISADSTPAPPRQTALSRSVALRFDAANSQRLQKGSSLGKVDRSSFWALQIGTLALLFWWICALLSFGRDRFNDLVLTVRFPLDLSTWTTYFEPFWGVLLGLVALFFASPWLLDRILKMVYGIKDLRRSELESFSPEALRLLKRVAESRSLPFPTLKRLPTETPLCFVYGYLPRNARIVLSQGLLEQLDPDEIAVLLAAEWAHIVQRDVGVLSLAAIVTQIPYLIYWFTAKWGSQQANSFLQGLAIGVSSIAYGIYWLLRIPVLLLSRIRLYFSDRTAVELTGNPNAMARALLKTTIGMENSLVQQGFTPPLVESLDSLLPVGYRQSLTLGSFYRETLDLLQWDCLQPHRAWLNAMNAHLLLGDRLSHIANYARHWQLEPQIVWQSQERIPVKTRSAKLNFAPILGVLVGWLLAGLLWAVGFVARRLGWLEIDWMWADWSVITGLGLIGFSVGTFLRINAFFPDIKRTALRTEPPLIEWLSNPAAMPIDSAPVRLQGQLYGRRGILNRLHQDLFLHTQEGTIRLHYTTRLGWFSDVLFQIVRPQLWLAPPAQTVTVVGWFRRGAIPWIDVETIQSQRGPIARSEHPLWSTILATIAALVGVYVIFTGGS